MPSLVCKCSHSYPDTLEKISLIKIENRLLDFHDVDQVPRAPIFPVIEAA